MKKILKEGKRFFSTQCKRCECVFSYDLEDLRRDSGFAYVEAIICPECGEHILHSDRLREETK